MRSYLCLFLLVFLGTAAKAQKLDVQHEGDKLFLYHKVAAKENWYSIGRIYNVSPKEIAPFNNTSLEKSLAIGQMIKVPLTPTNFIQSGQPGSGEVVVPLYHKVKEKEGLYRISQNYNKVPADQLKSWNKLSSDELSVGSELIVGWLVVKQDLSALAKDGQSQISGKAVAATTTVAQTTKPNQPTTTQQQTTNNQPPSGVVKETSSTTVATPAGGKTTTKPAENQPVSTVNKPVSDAPGTEGAFAGLFADQTKNSPSNKVSGECDSFKSTSGWKDGKYYVLMNKVTPGTIIKITSPSTNRSVYAKVLGEIPKQVENEGLLIRLSNSATAQLQMPAGKFAVELQY